MSPRRNWDSPNPSLASECALPPRTGGGHTRLRVRGWGSSNSEDWRKSFAVFVRYSIFAFEISRCKIYDYETIRGSCLLVTLSHTQRDSMV
jgi:hypothetical protein